MGLFYQISGFQRNADSYQIVPNVKMSRSGDNIPRQDSGDT